VCFDVELTALGEIRLLILEVLNGKERRRSLARRRGKDRRVGEDEAAGVEEIAHGIDDFVANAEYRLLPFAAYPEMPAIQKVIDAVFFGGDGIVVFMFSLALLISM